MGCANTKIEESSEELPKSEGSPSTVQTSEGTETSIRRNKLKIQYNESPRVLRRAGSSLSASGKPMSTLPETIGNLKIGEELGKGTWAVVTKGTHSKTGCEYALKSYWKKKIGRRELEHTAKREVALMRRLKEHPNVIGIVGVIDDQEWYHVVLDYAPGGSLQQAIDASPNRKLHHKDAMFYFKDLVRGLEYIHSMDICHRDIKPANLLIDNNGQTLKITDFGLGETLIGRGSMLLEQCGTPDYIAPEILLSSYNESCGYAGMPADVWSCGVTLYCMVVGRTPWCHGTQEFRNKEILSGSLRISRMGKVPLNIQELVVSMLIRDPSLRPTAVDLLFDDNLAASLTEPVIKPIDF
eukprot:TRINITY_DN6519_c0_g2_i3.p1 TRINITY_DN6519_c0_g2~~TRINITY_DN6519_c0_g2_i3.p1  ORF type:complete len:384 (+),score=39.37 TRINITY_DN6519_c0_g2_i3:92-1153(+)